MKQLADKFEQLLIVLRDCKNPLLVIHPKPDADALGSGFALRDYLLSLDGCTPTIFSVDKPGKAFNNLFPISDLIYEYDIAKHDAIIIIDRGDVFFKLKINEKIGETGVKPKLVNIDHHPHTAIPDALNVIDEEAAATCEIIYNFLEYANFPMDVKISQYLLDGIYADTGGFRHNNTSAQSLEISSRLMRRGASITKVNRVLFANKSINTLKLWGIALERAKIDPKSGMVVSFITKHDLEACNAAADDISGISEILNTIADSKFSLVLSEREQNKIKASLRSEEYKGIDVSKIARWFRGGGHKLASGFEIKGKLRQTGEGWVIE